MKRISFNKGKSFYTIDLEDKNKLYELMNKLNKKTWHNIVAKMDNVVVGDLFTSNPLITYITIKDFENKNLFKNLDETKLNFLNILINYLNLSKTDLII